MDPLKPNEPAEETTSWKPGQFTWTQVEPIIWKCEETGKYHFSDEVEQMDGTGYGTVNEAVIGAALYAQEWLEYLERGKRESK